MEGTPFGRYLLLELIGRGGMGEVWRAHDTATDRIVAIKVLPEHLSSDETFQERFRREAHAAARLNNPHIIPIHSYGEIDGRLYVDMRLIEGSDLHHVLAGGPLEPDQAVHIIEQVAKALHAAHKVGLVHRDVKPSNILLDDDYFAYLIDFGLARATGETRLTSVGNAVGTFHYMAPERLGEQPDDDARADIYALACVLYECLTGQPPFTTSNVSKLISAHLNEAPPQPSTSQPNIPRRLDNVIATGMAKKPDQRYNTTVDLAKAAQAAITAPIDQLPERPQGDRPTPTQRVRTTPPPVAPKPDVPSPPPRQTPPPRHTPPPRQTPPPVVPPAAAPRQAQPPWPAGGYPSAAPQQRPPQTPPPFVAPQPLFQPAEPPKKRRRTGVILAVVLVVVAIVVALLVMAILRTTHGSGSGGGSSSSHSSTATVPDKVVVDGQNQDISGTATCSTSGGEVSISVGSVIAVLTDADPPEVQSVGLGTVDNVLLTYISGAGENSAEATKSGKSYKITGTATGFDLSGFQEVSKSFEIDVTCP